MTPLSHDQYLLKAPVYEGDLLPKKLQIGSAGVRVKLCDYKYEICINQSEIEIRSFSSEILKIIFHVFTYS